MKGDGGRNGSEEKGRAENKHLLPERAQKTTWRRTAGRENRHALVWGQLVSWVQPWTLGPRTDREESKVQGLRAKRAAEDHPAILAGCTPRKVKRIPEVRIWHCLRADSSPTSSPATPPASQTQTKTRAGKAAQKAAGWWEQGRRKDRTGGQTDRQDVPASISRGPSFPDTHVIISLDRIRWHERECVLGGVETTLFWDRKIREKDTHTHAVKQREKEGYYIISTFFPPPLK